MQQAELEFARHCHMLMMLEALLLGVLTCTYYSTELLVTSAARAPPTATPDQCCR